MNVTEPLIAPHPFGRSISAADLRARFADCRSWEERYRQLIMLARQLPPLPEALRRQDIALNGCENNVWLGYQPRENGALHFYGDSDGRIVRGLLAVLLTAAEGKTAQELSQQDPLALFDQLGLRAQLSASRAGGLDALAQRIRHIAQQQALS
ncbi:cysteine desulfurase sulfur acceptor subunit CsdE [Affinibrenneria salicis]|uniref:Cysteine desulfurase sulfur acceptor subunit CsdE n=1 Tax=Affinibrenneria salicis TaxID=2590031 RepID=A0A5J5FS18_9GAMM|nr:cysteine desulfurase sulfur acceptor subunit CsdE [Affinibrenneria salicis]KAA8996081.1 cysteine desulfurase sulfur acceptor subunit CsdE [Affinibrenneria salicis]